MQTLFAWAAWHESKYPELTLLIHIPLGGKRSKSEAARFQREGVRKGFPDIFLPVARNGYHGLMIELKRTKGGRLSPEQAKWLEALSKQGYLAVTCFGASDAIKTIENYLTGRAK